MLKKFKIIELVDGKEVTVEKELDLREVDEVGKDEWKKKAQDLHKENAKLKEREVELVKESKMNAELAQHIAEQNTMFSNKAEPQKDIFERMYKKQP